MAGISEGEVAVYDRQLRLWGVQAQQRLLQAKVLIWGLSGSNIEVCKNEILAGVSLVLCDQRTVGPADVAFNYFLRSEDLGANVAESAAVRLQEMNPLSSVKTTSISAEEASSTASLATVLEGYNFVLLAPGSVDWDVDRISSINGVCRTKGIGFALTLHCGEIAFFFSDLGTHTVEERSSAQGAAGSSSTSPVEGAEAETLDFPSFQAWLDCPLEALQKSKVDPSFLLVALFLAFARSRGKGKVTPGDAAEFQDFCKRTAGVLPAVDGLPDLDSACRLFFLEPLVHVASIVGGLLAQEVIKAITKRDPPLVNSVCFNARTAAALVERIPAAPPVQKKRKAEEDVADLLDD